MPDENGNQYIMRLRPYRTVNDKIDGVVLTFVDITQLKKAEEEVKERVRRQEIISELGLFALKEEDLQNIIEKAIENICLITEVDYCLVLESDNEKELFRIIGSNLEDDNQEKTTFDINTKWDAGYALTLSEPLITEDYREEERYGVMPLLDGDDITSGIHINIGGTAENYGVLCLYTRKPYEASKYDINFVHIIANIIGSTIERSQAAQRLQKTNEQLQKEVERSTDLQKQLLSNSLEERWEIGEYLHDNLAQILASIKIIVTDIKNELSGIKKANVSSMLDEINSYIDLEIDNIRELSHEIIPIDVEEEGISHAFTLLIRRTQRIHNVKCRLEADGVLDKIGNREISSNLYHITQEAIKNAAIHGEANRILVSVNQQEDQLHLQIKDDGKGFSPEEISSEGMGLRIMEHRVDLMGGTFSIERLPDSEDFTTCLRCTFPIKSIME